MTKKICVGIDDERLLGIKWKDAFIFPSSEPQNAHSNAIVHLMIFLILFVPSSKLVGFSL